MSGNAPVRLPAQFLEKIWGATDLSPWYPSSASKIGEVWFEGDLPLLVKFIFTSDRLSVQVHPDDSFAAAHENSSGKTEMWYILRADPGARIALGLRETISRERLRESAHTGEIQDLLNWIEVKAGDAFFTPAGTIHAIGGGLALCEIQQRSNVTYRLFDYGRRRELHVDQAVSVASTEAGRSGSVALPIDCPYFHTELAKISSPLRYKPEPHRFHLLIFVSGSGALDGQPFREGETWLVPAAAEPFTIQPGEPAKFLRTWVP